MKKNINKTLFNLSRIYIRYFPFELGKWFLWERYVRFYKNLTYTYTTTDKNKIKFKIKLPDTIQSYIYIFGIWEPVITNYFKKAIKPGDTVIDIGANIGYYSLLSSKLVGSKGKVFSIEASPSIYTELLNNIKLNKQTNINTYNAAVYNKQENLVLYKADKENIGASSLFERNKYKYTEESTISANTLDKIIPPKSIKNARLIKVDIEGAEWFLVDGIKELIKETNADWLIEISPTDIKSTGGSVIEIKSIFFKSGYKAYIIDNKYDPSWYIRNNKDNIKLVETDLNIDDRFDILFTKKQLSNII